MTTPPVNEAVIDFALEKMKACEGWSATAIEINGVLQGGIIIVAGERAFDAVVECINGHCPKREAGNSRTDLRLPGKKL